MLSSFKSKIGNVFCPIHLWGFSNGVYMYYFVSSPGWGCMLKPFLLLWKKVKMANVKMFCHLIWKTFRHLDMANSIKTALWTCNLWTSKSVSYKSANWFQLNLPPQISKVFPIFKCIFFAILTFAIIQKLHTDFFKGILHFRKWQQL